MPTYEYRCRSCDATFEVKRAMSESDAPTPCPEGHHETVRLISAFASIGASSARSVPSAAPMAGGGCGGACACNPG